MTVQFVGGPWDGRIEDYPTRDGFRVLIEEDRPLYSYARYQRERHPEPGTPVRYLHDSGFVDICGVGVGPADD